VNDKLIETVQEAEAEYTKRGIIPIHDPDNI
jgi:hypothetical protein